MEKGALAVCGVTKDFTYGANVPCTSVRLFPYISGVRVISTRAILAISSISHDSLVIQVYVDRDFILKHSANTLRQFIGRVARTGLAPFGVAQVRPSSSSSSSLVLWGICAT